MIQIANRLISGQIDIFAIHSPGADQGQATPGLFLLAQPSPTELFLQQTEGVSFDIYFLVASELHMGRIHVFNHSQTDRALIRAIQTIDLGPLLRDTFQSPLILDPVHQPQFHIINSQKLGDGCHQLSAHEKTCDHDQDRIAKELLVLINQFAINKRTDSFGGTVGREELRIPQKPRLDPKAVFITGN